ncbi:unnamed protein product [Allacma fusca]|uniref:L-xylulose reductase n=1 Tax=Allacma fusca TaxID=39272 RepID=A0A8J2NIV0_9HEXA|nr:unnamed protein product [Allacma fusca]
MEAEFQGKRILVTGGARGLGEAIVRAFSKLGATVFALDREAEELSKLKESLPEVQTIVVDLLDWNSTKRAVEGIAPIHHLVNNAGVFGGSHKLVDVDEKRIETIMGINFKSVVNVSQTVVQGLVSSNAGGGTIVNISSVLSGQPFLNTSMYCCSKAALSMLTKCQAIEFGPNNVRVNSIRPTVMKTGLVTNPVEFQYLTDNLQNNQIISKLLEASEAAELVVFLSSSKSAMITGEEVVIDGGYLLH